MGIYFISQSPLDIPESILGQLGQKLQYALRAFTPKDKKTVKSVAESFPENPDLDTQSCITELGIGEALVSTLNEKGQPLPAQRILIRPPESQIGPLTADERTQQLEQSPYRGRYENAVDRESAYEILQQRAQKSAREEEHTAQQATEQSAQTKRPSSKRRQSSTETFIKSMARSIGSQLGRRIIRGLLGSLLKR